MRVHTDILIPYNHGQTIGGKPLCLPTENKKSHIWLLITIFNCQKPENVTSLDQPQGRFIRLQSLGLQVLLPTVYKQCDLGQIASLL